MYIHTHKLNTYRIKDHCQNCERLYELSVISDTIHCLTYCTDKLQYHLEKEIRDTESE